MKISDFGLSRDVYEEDSYVKRSKVGKKDGQVCLLCIYSNVKINKAYSFFPGPYTCQMDGDRVFV